MCSRGIAEKDTYLVSRWDHLISCSLQLYERIWKGGVWKCLWCCLVLEFLCPNLTWHLPHRATRYQTRSLDWPASAWPLKMLPVATGWEGEWNTNISGRVMSLFWLWSRRRDRGCCLPGSRWGAQTTEMTI